MFFPGGCRKERLLACRSMADSEVPAVASPADPNRLVEREAGLHRNLTPRQLSMIAVGGAIGTGLFLGSALSVQLAGPGVILSYIGAAGIALTLMWALGEMTIAHPVAGSFGCMQRCMCIPVRASRCGIRTGWGR